MADIVYTDYQSHVLAGLKAQNKNANQLAHALMRRLIRESKNLRDNMSESDRKSAEACQMCRHELKNVMFFNNAFAIEQLDDPDAKNISIEEDGTKLTCSITMRGGYNLKTILEAVPPEQHAAVLTAVLGASSIVIPKKAIEAVCKALDLKKSESTQLMMHSYSSSDPYVMMRESGDKTVLPFKFE